MAMSNGQMEAAACDVVNGFLQRAMGRGATRITAVLRPDTLWVHLQGVLTQIERTLVCPESRHRSLGEALVRDGRSLLFRQGKEELIGAMTLAIGIETATILHAVDPSSGNEMIAFSLRLPASEADGSVVPRRSVS